MKEALQMERLDGDFITARVGEACVAQPETDKETAHSRRQ
jgi:hypothetical protein